MHLRALFVLASTCALAAIAGGACSFPAVELKTDASSSAGSSSSGNGGGGASSSSSAASSASSSSSASSASSSGAGGQSVDCDVDGDTVKGPQCNGLDCDDGDDRAHPGQTTYFSDLARKTKGGWDFNCDGKDTPQFPKAVPCNAAGQCPFTNVYVGALPPACGQAGVFGSCDTALLSCKPGTLMSQLQPCR